MKYFELHAHTVREAQEQERRFLRKQEKELYETRLSKNRRNEKRSARASAQKGAA